MKIRKLKLILEVLGHVRVRDILTFLLKSWFMDNEYESCSMRELYVLIHYYKKFTESLSIKYVVDNFDCDDYAKLFSAYASAILKKNSVGIALGRLYYGDKFLGYHAWNIILTENGILFFEPQTLELFEKCTSDGLCYEVIAVVW